MSAIYYNKYYHPWAIYYRTGEELPTDCPVGSKAMNCDTWQESIFNGETWVDKPACSCSGTSGSNTAAVLGSGVLGTMILGSDK